MKKQKVKKLIMFIIFVIGITLLSILINIPLNMETTVSELKQEVQPQSSRGNEFTLGSATSGNNMSTMYDYDKRGGYTFCAGYNWEIARAREHASGSDLIIDGGLTNGNQQVTYSSPKQTELAQSVAFAKYYYPNNLSAIQDLIWASDDWLSHLSGGSCLAGDHEAKSYTSSGTDIYGRSYRFAEFAYNALDKGSEKLGIKGIPETNDDTRLRTMVDQSRDTYTVGPFTIDFPTSGNGLDHGSGNIGNLVYDEITHNYTGKFCTGTVKARITYQDGGSRDVGIGTILVLDENGSVIPTNFPYFGKTFYIQYQSSKSEAIVERINPIIEVSYTKKFSGGGSGGIIQAYTYKSSKARYKLTEDNGKVLYDCFAIAASNLDKHYYANMSPYPFRWALQDKIVRLQISPSLGAPQVGSGGGIGFSRESGNTLGKSVSMRKWIRTLYSY